MWVLLARPPSPFFFCSLWRALHGNVGERRRTRLVPHLRVSSPQSTRSALLVGGARGLLRLPLVPAADAVPEVLWSLADVSIAALAVSFDVRAARG